MRTLRGFSLAHARSEAIAPALVTMCRGTWGHAAEREALGFNDRNLHPDIYMNELLVGMRLIIHADGKTTS